MTLELDRVKTGPAAVAIDPVKEAKSSIVGGLAAAFKILVPGRTPVPKIY